MNLFVFDEKLVLVEPTLHVERTKEQIVSFAGLLSICSSEKAVLITGPDRSGKTLIAKYLQEKLTEDGKPCVVISGKQIKNKNIDRIILGAKLKQFGNVNYPDLKFRVIIDDFDECNLSDRIKEEIILKTHELYQGSIITSFSNAPSVLYTSNALPIPEIVQIAQLNDAKLLELVRRWLHVGVSEQEIIPDIHVLSNYEKLQLIFGQTELEKFAYTAITFLELIDTSTGSDLAFSSFAACYDNLISCRLQKANINWRTFDESKNFLSLLAYRAYVENATSKLSYDSFEDCLSFFETNFLSSRSTLRSISVGLFIREEDDGYAFYEEYLWYFLCARHVVKVLQTQNNDEFSLFVKHCTENIFQKRFANIVIYIAYFSSDNLVLLSLLNTLDNLFSKAADWIMSDDTREIMLGFISNADLLLEAKADVTENRVALLQEKISDIVENAEKLVASYTLPFLNSSIDDSKQMEELDGGTVDADSYIKSVNALLRTHSIIGQILNARTGTYDAALIIDCITRMVKASGRYASLNHAIATVLLHDEENQKMVISKLYKKTKLSDDEKYEKVTRLFAFWSVYMSHAGLARYLGQEHSIRALTRLAEQYENGKVVTAKGNVPYNFSLVLLVARLYHTGKIDKNYIEECLHRYGPSSSIMALVRVVIHIYAYYFPLDIEDKQWIANKMKMSLRRLELQSMKSGSFIKINQITR